MYTIPEIAAKLGRSEAEIEAAIYDLGFLPSPGLTGDDVYQRLVELYATEQSDDSIEVETQPEARELRYIPREVNAKLDAARCDGVKMNVSDE